MKHSKESYGTLGSLLTRPGTSVPGVSQSHAYQQENKEKAGRKPTNTKKQGGASVVLWTHPSCCQAVQGTAVVQEWKGSIHQQLAAKGTS